MPTPDEQRLARMQREADRAKALATEGLATCAGMDSQGRVLVQQGGVVRPLEQYQSNAGAKFGQPIEVVFDTGAITPRKASPVVVEPLKKFTTAEWWAVTRVDSGTTWQYWIGGSNQPPLLVFNAPKTIPGCQFTARLYAEYTVSNIQTFSREATVSAAQMAQIQTAVDGFSRMSLCDLLTILGWTHIQYNPPLDANYSLGTGVFTVAPNPTNSTAPPYFQPGISAPTSCGIRQGINSYVQVINQGGNPFDCLIDFLSPFGIRISIRGRGHALSLSQTALIQAGSAGQIDSYLIPTVPRSSDPEVLLGVLDQVPYFRLRHSRQCSDIQPAPYAFDETKTVSGGAIQPAVWPQFPPPAEQTIGTSSVYFIAISGGIPFPPQGPDTGRYPIKIETRERGAAPNPLKATIAARALQRWQWPSGVLEKIGYFLKS